MTGCSNRYRYTDSGLKIDRFFTNGLDEYDREGSAIVSAIIKLALTLEMEVVAEGFETDSQLAKLRDMGCDEVQGNLLGKPMTDEEFNTLLHQQVDQNLNIQSRFVANVRANHRF